MEIYDQAPPDPASGNVRFNEHGGKEVYGVLRYPGVGEGCVSRGDWEDFSRVVLFTHTDCGPDCGYAIPFHRINDNWDRHLSEKTWCDECIDEALTIAREALTEAGVAC
jgi:hypothetical protein